MENKVTQSHFCEGFEPVRADDPSWMILGTMPSVASLEQAFYYAHPQNQFWPIMQNISGLEAETLDDKIRIVNKLNMVLWDVLQACDREGSLDSAIKKPQANDFELFFKEYNRVSTVVFNGQKAYQLFKQQVIKKQNIPESLQYRVMPSTSPANATIKKQDKHLFWQENLQDLLAF